MGKATAPIFEGPEAYSPIREPHFANTHYGSVRGRTLLVSTSTERAYAVMVDVSTVRISEAPGGEYRLLEISICEYSMRGSLALHYDRPTSPRNEQASLSTVIVSKQGIFEVSS